jgi:uracil-DNA glycosylase family 4
MSMSDQTEIETIKRDAFITLAGEIKNSISYMAQMGCKGFECSDQSLGTLNRWRQGNPFRSDTLEDIKKSLGRCKRCGLARGRNNIVFGTGDPNARLVFVGEGPGFEEDKVGKPFVGAAGQLLTKIIQAINLTRDSVYICNIIKCRPPKNRNPLPEEIDECLPFFKRQIMAVNPDFICALGSVAARTLLETTIPISRLRGRFHEYEGIKVMPTYHPAYLLRNPEKKRDVWEDMKMLMKEYGER